MNFEALFSQIFLIFIDFHCKARIIDFVKSSIFPRENHVFLEFRTPWEGTFSELSDFRKGWILGRKNLPKLRSKSIKIDLDFHIEIYLKFSSVLVVGGIFAYDFLVGGVHPTSKDGSSPWPGAGEVLQTLKYLFGFSALELTCWHPFCPSQNNLCVTSNQFCPF